jgi:DNA-binding MarR family transcriptional regulator
MSFSLPPAVSQLTVLYLAGPQTVQAIAGSLGLDRTTLTRNLKLLEEAGVIGIEPGEDQRTRIVSLTQPGTHSLLKVLPVWEKAQATVVEGIGEERFEALLGHLAEVSELDVGRAARARKTARARGQRAGHSVRARR